MIKKSLRFIFIIIIIKKMMKPLKILVNMFLKLLHIRKMSDLDVINLVRKDEIDIIDRS